MLCSLCPRKCNASRDASHPGFCGVGWEPVIARAAPHHWEEPCISGQRGSGAVFFAGCALRCAFCQNAAISAGGAGKAVSADRLRAIFRELEEQGVHNLNLVTASHFLPAVLQALTPPPDIPVVWNTGGYESLPALRALEGKVQAYLPDMKYMDAALAERLSGAGDYPAVAKAAILEMFRQTGPYALDDDGMLVKGVMIRHLVLPGELDNTFAVLDWIRDTFHDGDVLVSLMGQYTPNGRGGPDRRLTQEEYQRACDYMAALGLLEGYTQELSSAEAAYTPPFDGTGV